MNIQHNHTALSHRTATPTAASYLTDLAAQFFYKAVMLISQVTLFIKNTNEWKPRAGADEAGVTSAQKGIIRPQVIQQPRDNHSSKSLQMPLECSHFSISKGASASRSHDRRIDQQYSGPTGVLPYWRWSRKEGMQAERCTALGNWMYKKMFLKKLLIGRAHANSVSFFTRS